MIEPCPTCTVAFASNEKGVLPLSVTIFSLLDSAHDTTAYRIIVCSDNICEDSKTGIEELVKRMSSRHCVQFIDMENIYDGSKDMGEICGNWPRSAWARFFLPELLPDVDRILYLDIDMLICDDCSCLFNLDMKGAVVGGVYESISCKDDNHNKALGIPEIFQGYVNTGTLLIDMNEFRRHSWGRKIIDFAHSHAHELPYPDQDSMNAVLYEHIFRLHPHWNWNDIGTRRILNHSSNTKSLIRAATLKEAVEASVFPGILHYCGDRKPWKYNYHITRVRYEQALIKSGVKGYNLRDGWSFKIFRKRLTYTLIYKLTWMKIRRLAKYFNISAPPPAATWGVSRDFAPKGWSGDNF